MHTQHTKGQVPLILAIDFDETIAINSPFPKLVGIKRQADYYIRKLVEEGYYIIIWSCRSDGDAEDAKEFLTTHNIPYHQFNEQHPSCIEYYNNDTRKVAADLYIDDKCLMGLPDWEEIYNIIKSKDIQYPVLSFVHAQHEKE